MGLLLIILTTRYEELVMLFIICMKLFGILIVCVFIGRGVVEVIDRRMDGMFMTKVNSSKSCLTMLAIAITLYLIGSFVII